MFLWVVVGLFFIIIICLFCRFRGGFNCKGDCFWIIWVLGFNWVMELRIWVIWVIVVILVLGIRIMFVILSIVFFGW